MLFEFKNVSFRYAASSDPSLRNVSFSCDASTITGLAGANGSGKTTLLRIMLGQLVGFEGTYTISGQPVSDTVGNICSRYNIGYSPDNPVLDDVLTGFEILSLVASIRGIDNDTFAKEVALFSEYLHIEGWMRTARCGGYSTGMKKKIAIAAAYLGSPAFVVLDEPTNGLDPVSTFGLKKLILLKKEKGIGCIVASHVLDFVEKTATGVLLLKNGAAVFSGNLTDLRAQYPQAGSLEELYFTLYSA